VNTCTYPFIKPVEVDDDDDDDDNDDGYNNNYKITIVSFGFDEKTGRAIVAIIM
jgi:hypothetical protein